MNGVEFEGLPEEGPISLDPEALEDLIEPVGEVVEPVEPHGRGRKNDRA